MHETPTRFEEVARFPPPGMAAPVSYAFSSDDRWLTYLYGPDQSPVRQLNALIAHRVRYEPMPFPDERHMPRKMEDRVSIKERIAEFFEKHSWCQPRPIARQTGNRMYPHLW